MKEFLSKRGQTFVKDMPPLVHAHFSTLNDQYHPEKNPKGHINMGTAETHLINDEVLDLIQKSQSRINFSSKTIHYDLFNGSNEFRTAIADYWQNLIFGKDSNKRLTADNIVIGAGCSSALEMLAQMLGDAEDVVLVPTPFYSGFMDDFHERARVLPVGVHAGLELNTDAFEAALEEQKSKGKKVCAVLFSSPNNPVGTVYSEDAVKGLIAFCMKHNLDLISDEIYAQTIHDPKAKWFSTYSLVPDEYMHRVHITSSFAKDFALSGFRTGFLFSYNKDLIKGATTIAYFNAISTHTQALLTEVLRAPELPAVIKRNKEQLRAGYELIVEALNGIGVEVMPAEGGIFVFANFAPYMEKAEFEAEYTLWRKIFEELKLNISPGQLFAAEKPGWFRVCYAHDPAIVAEACRRLKTLQK